MKKLFLILILLLAPYMAFARGGGGCLAIGSLIDSPTGKRKVESLKPGEAVLSPSGNLAFVSAVYRVSAEEFVSIKACQSEILVTPTHPFKTANGVYREAEVILPGEKILLNKNSVTVSCPVERIKKIRRKSSAYNLLVYPGGEYVAEGFEVHNKGCFLPDTFILKADGSQTKISSLKVGDELLAFEKDGRITSTKVREIIKLQAYEYFEIKTPSITVLATAEHPFYVGNGTYKTVASLKKGDFIYAFDGSGLSRCQLLSVERKTGKTDIYNLRTEKPNTFFANFVAVHNKGGGCFPLGVKIYSPYGPKNIETIKPNDTVLAFENGKTIPVKVKSVYEKLDYVLILFTDRGILRTTAEHPLLGENGFKPAGQFKVGEKIAFCKIDSQGMTTVRGLSRSQTLEKVYNLSVEAPNTFIADGFVAHNKGGGFHYSGSRHRSPSSPTEEKLQLLFFILVGILAFLAKDSDEESEELDYLFSRREIEKKSSKTEKLLDFISKTDANFSKEKLTKVVRETFEKLQACWSARDYTPMKSLMMPHLYAQHTAQLEMMRSAHEINILEDLKILAIDIVGVRYTKNPQQRFFTALITAQAKDYYIDDRNGEFLRGDESVTQFQEFWSFKFDGQSWLLDRIEQTAESDVLTREDFMEQFTDDGVSQIIEAPIDDVGPSGPQIPSDVLDKRVKIVRMINFLGESDKMWNLAKMEIDASLAFINVYEAWAKGDPSLLSTSMLTPAALAEIKDLIEKRNAEGIRLEFRNFCIRKVDVVLVNNKQDDKEDEFVVRFSAHAQKKMIKDQQVIASDEYVKPFTEYWCFVRGNGRWQLKEILTKGEGELAVSRKNQDEESGPMLLEWYYTKKRPYS